MAIRKLTLSKGKKPSAAVLQKRIADIRETVEHYAPDTAAAIRAYAACVPPSGPTWNHNKFAPFYEPGELTLLAMTIEYAGMYGVEINFVGKNNEV